jgi:adenylate cyclase
MSYFLIWEGRDGDSKSWHLGDAPFLLDKPVTFGRSAKDSDVSLPDNYLSRRHMELTWQSEGLAVSLVPGAKNSIFQGTEAKDSFLCFVGDSFASGRSKFRVTGGATLLNRTLSAARERRVFEIFQELPEKIAKVHREGAYGADPASLALEIAEDMVHQVTSASIVESESIDKVKRPVSHSFALSQANQTGITCVDFTDSQDGVSGQDWCSAIPLRFGDRVVFALIEGECLKSERTLVEDAVSLLDVVLQALTVQFVVREKAIFEEKISQFFSPRLRGHISPKAMDELLRPKKVVATLMFFDLRGFSKGVEAADHLDSILQHHQDLQECMSEVTEAVFDSGGIVIDFQGDALFACWGALGMDPNHVKSAIQCTEKIAEAMHDRGVGFGMGMATGQVIAGQVGGREQQKFGLIGNVVNLCSRLEGLTKQLGVKVLTNDGLYQALAEPGRLRTVGAVQPAGLVNAEIVHELLLSPDVGGTPITPEEVAQYEKAESLYRAGDLTAASKMLESMQNDPVASFLSERCQASSTPPDGVLRFTKK